MFLWLTIKIPFTFQIPILDKLKSGETIIGDGGLTYALEKRGYVNVTDWTPEAVVEYPDAGDIIVIIT